MAFRGLRNCSHNAHTWHMPSYIGPSKMHADLLSVELHLFHDMAFLRQSVMLFGGGPP